MIRYLQYQKLGQDMADYGIYRDTFEVSSRRSFTIPVVELLLPKSSSVIHTDLSFTPSCSSPMRACTLDNSSTPERTLP